MRDYCHIDHYNPTFKEIFEAWIRDKNITESDVNQSFDNNETTVFVNKKLESGFREFHNKVANLRAVSPYVNLVVLKKNNEHVD